MSTLPASPAPAPPGLPSTHALFEAGTRARIAAHRAEESGKSGTFRAGNSGVFIDEGTIAGACHRKTALRFMGVETPQTAEESRSWEWRQLMFELGHLNEVAWVGVLAAGLPPGYVIRTEAEVPVAWDFTHDGRKYAVSGRPDIVIGTQDVAGKFLPLRGHEHKSTSSQYTHVDTLFGGEPKLDHLAQAGHYMMALACPEYEIWYTSRVDWHVGHFAERWPAPGSLFSRFAEYAWYTVTGKDAHRYVADRVTGRKEMRAKKSTPSISGYALRFAPDGVLEYRHLTAAFLGGENAAPWKRSVVSRDGITDYYRYVADTIRMKDLGPRVSTLAADGSKKRFSVCDYCELKPICVKHERMGFDAWVEAVRNRTGTEIVADPTTTATTGSPFRAKKRGK